MNFDLSPQFLLTEKKDRKIYAILRFSSYFLALILFIIVGYRILFPTEYFNFSFLNSSSLKNTVTDVKNSSGFFPERGNIPDQEKISFFASPFAQDQSEAIVSITLSKKSAELQEGKLTIRKSFKAFFYPQEQESIDIRKKRLDSQELADGSVVTYGTGAYVVSGEEIFPIDSLETFQALGYDWSGVENISADVFSRFKKGKLISMSSAHPNGTILQDSEGNFFLIRDNRKNPLEPKNMVLDQVKNKPIVVSSDSLFREKKCSLKKNIWPLRSYSCSIPLNEINDLLGKDYLFELETANNVKIDTIALQFKKNPTKENIRFTLSNIIKRIKANYAPEN